MTRPVRGISPLDLSASPALSFEGLERSANYRTISFREDVLHVLDKREAAAIIFQIIFRWQEYLRDKVLAEIEQRRTNGLPPLTPAAIEERMWVYMSYTQFVRESGGALGYNTVIRTLHYLIHEKQVLEQRANRDPRYSDYEYRINRPVVRDLLITLPPFPSLAPKKAKPEPTVDPTHTGTATPQLGTSLPDPDATHLGTDPLQLSIRSPQMGTANYPHGETTQESLQDSPQESSQQQTSNARHDAQAAPAASGSQPARPSDEGVARIPVHRSCTISQVVQEQDILPALENTAGVSGNNDSDAPALSNETGKCEKPGSTPPEPALSASEEQSMQQALPTAAPNTTSQEARTPPQEPALSAQSLVALVERKRGMSYDTQARPRQLAAARQLLDLHLPLDLACFERLYDACHDDWWKAHFGDLHLTHLIEREKHGQLRITRLLARLQASDRRVARETAVTLTSEQANDRTPIIGVSGRPVFQPSGQPLKILSPERPARHSLISSLGV